MFIIYRPTVTLLLHNFDLFRTCRSSFCTVAWQLARFQLTRRIARSLGDSRAFCHQTSRQLVTSRSQSRLGLTTSRLGLVSVSVEKVSCTSSLANTQKTQQFYFRLKNPTNSLRLHCVNPEVHRYRLRLAPVYSIENTARKLE